VSGILCHPFRQKDLLHTYPETRLLHCDFGIVGVQIQDMLLPSRVWTIQGCYAPIPKRALGGIRTKVVDNKGFISFVNQRDLEVLLGFAQPGDYCPWTQEEYPDYDDREWYGICADDDDLLDDLLDRELILRGDSGFLPAGIEIKRHVHLGDKNDAEELHFLLWDGDPASGISPDPRLRTVDRRWSRVERTRIRWEEVL
jgi:hypothetical protein